MPTLLVALDKVLRVDCALVLAVHSLFHRVGFLGCMLQLNPLHNCCLEWLGRCCVDGLVALQQLVIVWVSSCQC